MIRTIVIASVVLGTAVACAGVGPQQRAKAALDAQLAAMPGHDDKFVALFAKGAVVVTPKHASLADDDSLSFGTEITTVHPHATLVSKKIDKLVAGGNANVVWFSADLAFTVHSSEGGKTDDAVTRLHVVELLDGAQDWKPVVAAFSEVKKLAYYERPRGEVPAPTSPGPLAKLIADPAALSAALGADAVVLGTDPGDRAQGKAAAQKMLAKWTKLGLSIEQHDKVHEVATKTYAYAIANVDMPNEKPNEAPYRMHAVVVAIPDGNGWQVVAATYGAQ